MTIKPSATYAGLLEDIAIAANESDTPEDALRIALRRVSEVTGWPVGHALKRVTDSEVRSTGIWHIADGKPLPEFDAFRQFSEARCFSTGVGMPGRVLADGAPSWIADLDLDGNYPRQQFAHAARLGASFAFPVRSGADVVGVLEFYAHTPQSPDAELLEIMAQVGIQLGRVFERHAAREAMAASERRVRQILDSAGDAFIGMDADGRITAWNKAATATFGWSTDEALGRTVTDTIVPPQYREAHAQGLKRFLATGTPRVLGQRLELSGFNNAGNEFPIEISLWSLQGEDGPSFYAFARDITERKNAERELEWQANHDALTGLPNRTLLLDRLEQLLMRRDCPRKGPALLFVDLDHFKRINDSLGHEAGDQALVAVANLLRQVVRPMDTVARLSGDEFVVVCPDVGSHRDAAVLAKRLLAALADPIRIKDDSVFLTTSIGIAIADEGCDADSLIGSADTAMYQAKKSGRGQYELFDERMRLKVTSRLRVETELRSAVEREQLRLHFQPIVNAADGTIVAVEALLRWEHPDLGLLSPAEFIPVAEETGLIVPIGAWVLEEACRCAQTWERAAAVGAPLCVSINLSARQLAQSDLVLTVERILASVPINPERVQFGVEVTETVVMRDPAAASRTLHALRALDVHLSIDDFGTGYSSLAYLKHFPVDAVKVDRSFVREIASDAADHAIVRAVTALARSLGLTVVAEGVETQEQARALRAAGVDMMQGFLYARPMPAQELLRTAWLSPASLDQKPARRVRSGVLGGR